MSIQNHVVPNMKYHADDWKIVTKQEKEIERISGLQFLSSNQFYGNCVEWYLYTYEEYVNKSEEINKIINNRWFFAVVNSTNQDKIVLLSNKYQNLKNDIDKYQYDISTITLVNRIEYCPGACSGVVISDGKNKLTVEIMVDSVNTRDITEGHKDLNNLITLISGDISLKVVCGKNNQYIDSEYYKSVIYKVIQYCKKMSGYYEFIFGSNQIYNFPNLFFTYYSPNIRYGFTNKKWK